VTQPQRSPWQRSRAGPGPVQPPSALDRLRAATSTRSPDRPAAPLVKDGPEAVSLRAIARENGMTAPGSPVLSTTMRTGQATCGADIFTELGADLHTGLEAADHPRTVHVRRPQGETDVKLPPPAKFPAAGR